jgi:hypothetical protein
MRLSSLPDRRRTMSDHHGFDLDFRPRTYWVFADARQQLRATVKGEARRVIAETVADAADLGDDIRCDSFYSRSGLDEEERAAWGRAHPQFLGGEFLSDPLPGEVEIARVWMDSTTGDVISVRARRAGGLIHYRVVDEYPEYWSFRWEPAMSAEPLTLRQLITLMDNTEQYDSSEVHYRGLVLGLLDRQVWCGADPDSVTGFVRPSSAFYHELTDYYLAAIEEWYERRMRELRGEDM